MKIKLPPVLEQFVPFIVLGALLVMAFWLLILFSYVLFWGVLVGALIWGIQRIKTSLLTTPSAESSPKHLGRKKPGRIIEHDKNK